MVSDLPEIASPGDVGHLRDGDLAAAYSAARLGVIATPPLWLADEVFARWSGGADDE